MLLLSKPSFVTHLSFLQWLCDSYAELIITASFCACQLLCLYKQQMFFIYELVSSKHTGMAAFTDFSLTSSITVKTKQIFRIGND